MLHESPQQESIADNDVPGVFGRVHYFAVQVVKFGSLLAAISGYCLGRGFRPGDLGVVFWPLVALYLCSLFYCVGHIVFTMSSGLKWIVAPLYCLLVALLLSLGIWQAFFQ